MGASTPIDEEGALTPPDPDSVGTNEPTVLPGNGAAASRAEDGEDRAGESPLAILNRLRTTTAERHEQVTGLRTDVAQLGGQIAKIRQEREALLDELAKLRVELAKAIEPVGEHTPEDVQPPVGEPATGAQPPQEQSGSHASDSAAAGRFRLPWRR